MFAVVGAIAPRVLDVVAGEFEADSISWLARNQLPPWLSRSFAPSCRNTRSGFRSVLRISVGKSFPPRRPT